MFTGIIDHCGIIQSVTVFSQMTRLVITHQFDDLIPGESIAIDGICLTVTRFAHNQFECELSSETLRLTTASRYTANQTVNCERAMCLSDRLGGHLVTGHVDSQLLVKSITDSGDCKIIEFFVVDRQKLGLISQKGCIAINGVSLTINTVFDNGFSVMLIPYTLMHTNLFHLKINEFVNVEFDYLAKLVERQLSMSTYHEHTIS